ncbi:glycoside hydrolase family 12 protein [Parathielavia appendiculata]|uniref:Glycoside hydrolase family 12 protein n=1 Tax=Parathielavia appendiculata TaxID=2587402 RepID=A0AAN6TW93_9PEZI|nr:glycoside hydrolase family 12 protein [Parathielavia appendiculata]
MKLVLPLISTLAAAAPYRTSRRQVATLCEQYGYWSGNGYEVNNNLWGAGSASSGSQCTYVDGSSSSSVSWYTTWTWEGSPGSVKSYANSGRQIARGQTIASIRSMATSVSWAYNTSSIRANVAYDFFTSEDPNHPNSGGDYELMIWLAKYGDNTYPVGSVSGTVTVAGNSWTLYAGSNGGMQVYSFVAMSAMNSFSGDAKDFFNYLTDNEAFPADTQNLIVFQVGTEAFDGGPATFTVSQFTAIVD